MTKLATKQRQKSASLFTVEEEELLRGRFADTWTGRLSILVVALFFAFLGIWAFTSMIAQAKTPAPWQNLVHLHKFIKGFHLAGVTMGMTPDMVRTLYPKLTLLSGDDQEQRGSFVANHTPYSVWFSNIAGKNNSTPNGTPQAYRIRTHRHYNASDENEALNVFGRKLGRPLTSSCMRSRLTTSSKTCVFKWLRNGIDVTMVSKLIRFINADPRTYVSITATDTLTAAKIHRRKTQRQLARSRTP